MTKRRLFGVIFYGGVLLASGVVPAGAAPGAPPTAKLLGPNNRPCGGDFGNETFGTVAIQTAKIKGRAAADERTLRVIVVADKVRARTTYDVRLAATVTSASAVGCYAGWSAGLTTSSSGGMISYSGLVTVPASAGSFQVWVGPVETPADIGYVSNHISVGGL